MKHPHIKVELRNMPMLAMLLIMVACEHAEHGRNLVSVATTMCVHC